MGRPFARLRREFHAARREGRAGRGGGARPCRLSDQLPVATRPIRQPLPASAESASPKPRLGKSTVSIGRVGRIVSKARASRHRAVGGPGRQGGERRLSLPGGPGPGHCAGPAAGIGQSTHSRRRRAAVPRSRTPRMFENSRSGTARATAGGRLGCPAAWGGTRLPEGNGGGMAPPSCWFVSRPICLISFAGPQRIFIRLEPGLVRHARAHTRTHTIKQTNKHTMWHGYSHLHFHPRLSARSHPPTCPPLPL